VKKVEQRRKEAEEEEIKKKKTDDAITNTRLNGMTYCHTLRAYGGKRCCRPS
jgi:hypothetical protein